jgi:phage shock protein B
MDDNFVAICAILSPVFIILAVRLTKRRDTGLAAIDQQHMLALTETARRMERRIESLEMLLDTEVPGWRSRSGVR